MSQTLIEKVLSGKSNAHVFDHNTCAELWARGYTDVRSGEHLNPDIFTSRLIGHIREYLLRRDK